MLRVILAFVASSLMVAGALAQDGARAYFLLPVDTNIVSLTGNYIHSEFAGSTVDVGTVTPSYRRTIDVGGNAGAVLIGLPVGAMSGAIMVGPGVVVSQTAPPAIGDLFVGGELGLVGSPALNPLDYSQYKPDLKVAIAAKLFIPTGYYDSNRLVNLGQNRFSFQASLPISYVLADSMIDPSITTLEIVPSVHIFGNNNDAVGPGSVATQEPLFKVEGHVTHTFSPMVWGALDAYAEAGGKAAIDGVEIPGAHQSVSVGATLGLVLSRTVSMRLNYTQLVYSNVANSAGRSVELTTAFTF